MTFKLNKALAWSGVHLIAIATIFALITTIFMTESAVELFHVVWGIETLRPHLVWSLATNVVIASVIWGMVVLTTQVFRRTRVSVRRAHGAVMTETVIILPIFFLLTSGLAQMSINSMAGLLTTLGAYEASRTLQVWAPEVNNARISGPTTRAQAEDRARLAVAMVVTPVASELASQNCAPSNVLRQALQGLAFEGMEATPVPRDQIWSYVEAFSDSSFATRGPTKLTTAYCNTEVSYTDVPTDPAEPRGRRFTTTVRYSHAASFPLVRKIFPKGPIERSYVNFSELPPNPELPNRVIF